MGMGEDKLAKWLQKEGQIMLAIKKKFWFIQEPLDEKTFTWIRKKFQQRECFSEKVLFINLRWRFANEKNGIFLTRVGGGGGYKDTPGSSFCLLLAWKTNRHLFLENM